MRSATCATTPRSCVIKSKARPRSRRSCASNSRICFCTVTSSAVVGSSAMRRRGDFPCISRERHGNHRALSQASGKLMRKLSRAHGWFWNSGAFERFHHAAIDFLARKACVMRANRFGNLRAHAHDGIERRHRLLKNHGDVASAHGDPFALGKREQIHARSGGAISSREPCFAAHARARRQQTHQRQREHRFPAARFADKSERFAGLKRKRNVVHRTNPSRGRGNFDGESAQLDQCGHCYIISRILLGHGKETSGEWSEGNPEMCPIRNGCKNWRENNLKFQIPNLKLDEQKHCPPVVEGCCCKTYVGRCGFEAASPLRGLRNEEAAPWMYKIESACG